MNRPRRRRSSSRDFWKPKSNEGQILYDSRNLSINRSENRSVTQSNSTLELYKSQNPQSSEVKDSELCDRPSRRRRRIDWKHNQTRAVSLATTNRTSTKHGNGGQTTKKGKTTTMPNNGPKVLYSRNMSPESILDQTEQTLYWDDDPSGSDGREASSDLDSDEVSRKDEEAIVINQLHKSHQEHNKKTYKIIVFLWNVEGCPVPKGFSEQQIISKLLEIGNQQSYLPSRVTCLVGEDHLLLLQDIKHLGDVEVIACEANLTSILASMMLEQIANLTEQHKVYLIGINVVTDPEDYRNSLEIIQVGNRDCKHTTNVYQYITFEELVDNEKSKEITYSYVEVNKISNSLDKKKLRFALRKSLKCNWCKFLDGKAYLRFSNISLVKEACKEDAMHVLFGEQITFQILTNEQAAEFLKIFRENHSKLRREKQAKPNLHFITVKLTGEISENILKEKLLEQWKDDCFTIQQEDGMYLSKNSTYIVSIILSQKLEPERITKVFQELSATSHIQQIEIKVEESSKPGKGKNRKTRAVNSMFLEVSKTKDDWIQSIKKAEENHQKKVEVIDKEMKMAKQTDNEEDILITLNNKKEELRKQLREFQKFSNNLLEQLENINTEIFNLSRMNDLRLAFTCEIQRLQEALPIYAAKSEILDAVIDNQVIILLAETGSGKSTQLVQYLLQTNIALNGVIACTQPRRIAASSLATHVAHQMLSNVGQTVGYRVGLTNRSNKSTKIIYMTDQSLLSEILEDPDLTKYSCIIVDEAHERSIYTDLLIAMIKRCLQRRSDLKVVITSATIDPKLFVKYFDGCPVLRVPGRTFPVKIMWSKHNTIHTEHDYVKAAVAVVLQIHTKDAFKERGDVLVFLTGVAEIETAIQLMECQPEDIKNSLIILPLHGKLQPDQQNKVFETTPRGRRKIVFSTNVAETSVTIPGIKYVVDCGYTKDVQFDPKRNLSSLTLSIISQSSAEQRKGRAGRMEPGICYRMYSEEDFNSFDGIQRPELLRVNLEQAVLKLLELGISNLKEFDFVEAPSSESLETAISSLEDLEAIINGRITELGLKMSKLSIIPHLAKLILHGIEKDIGFEALIIAACATVSSSVFFRSGTDEEKANADAEKILFCLPDGDFITQLAVYKEWLAVNEKEKTPWCFKKKINGKALRMARDTIKELNMVIRKELRQSVELKFSTSDNTNIILRRLIFESYFKKNLCLSYGPQQAGYFHLYTQQRVHIHPSSALHYLGRITPKFIVYNQLLKTSRTFTIGVTPVDEEWVKQMIDEKKLNVDWDFLQNLIIQPKVFHPIGPALMAKILIGKANSKRKELEKKLTQTLDDEVFTDASLARGEFTIYAASHHHQKLENVIQELLKPEKECLSSEIEERYQDNSNLRFLMGRGGEIRHVLYPEDYCEVSVELTPDTVTKEILDVLSCCGKIIFHQEKFRRPKKLFVKFQNPDHAKLAVNNIEEFKVNPVHKVQNKNQMDHLFHVKVLWTRRLNRRLGFIKPKNSFDLIQAFNIFQNKSVDYRYYGQFSSGYLKVQIDKKSRTQLCLTNLNTDLNNDMFQSLVNDIFRPEHIEIQDAFVVASDSFDSTVEDCRNMETELKNVLQKHVDLSQVNVHVIQPKPKSLVWLASVSFEDPSIGRNIVRLIHLKETISNRRLFVRVNLKATLYCRRDVYQTTQDLLLDILKKYEKTSKKLEVIAEDVEPNLKAIRIISDNVEEAFDIHFAICKLLNGEKLECPDPSYLKTLLTSNGKQFLQSVMSKTTTLIIVDCYRRKNITLYGNPEKIKEAKERIKSYFGKMDAGFEEKTFALLGEDKPKGLIKGLLLKYGSTLEHLQQETRVEVLHLDVSKHRLTVFGSEESIKKVNTQLEDVIANVKSNPVCLKIPTVDLHQSVSEDCPVCFTPVDVTSTDAHFRLQLCGHSYCLECIQGLIGSRTFPLKCIYENCDDLFCVKDIKILFKQFEKLMGYLDASAVDDLVKKHQDKFAYCITPNCKGIYNCSERRFQCSDCRIVICTSCRVRYHDGFSCDEYKKLNIEDSGEDLSLKVWMKAHPGQTKFCPSCRSAIEKTAGCDHMTCTNCKGHFCWRCNQQFSESFIYTHLTTCTANTSIQPPPQIIRPPEVRQYIRPAQELLPPDIPVRQAVNYRATQPEVRQFIRPAQRWLPPDIPVGQTVNHRPEVREQPRQTRKESSCTIL